MLNLYLAIFVLTEFADASFVAVNIVTAMILARDRHENPPGIFPHCGVDSHRPHHFFPDHNEQKGSYNDRTARRVQAVQGLSRIQRYRLAIFPVRGSQGHLGRNKIRSAEGTMHPI